MFTSKSPVLLCLVVASLAGPAMAFSTAPHTRQPQHGFGFSSLQILPSDDNDNQAPSSRRSILRKTLAAIALAGVTSISLQPTRSSYAAVLGDVTVGGAIQYGDESIMSPKAHGTSEQPVQQDLLYGVSNKLADKICNYNRHFAEMGGYFLNTNFEDTVLEAKGPITFYDSVTGKPLFVAPLNRSPDEFLKESEVHGWPSFRDDEVVWENVRVLKNSGETVSVDGTHLGHNLPDRKGNRYCINLVSVAGKPTKSA